MSVGESVRLLIRSTDVEHGFGIPTLGIRVQIPPGGDSVAIDFVAAEPGRQWCETRIDGMLKFSDATWRTIEGSGAQMMFFGAESGSDAALRAMSKDLTTAQTLEIATRLARTTIIPEFSFMLGGPDDPDEEIFFNTQLD